MSLFWQCLPFSCFSSVGKTDRLIVEKCARDIFFEPRTWPYYLLLLRQAVQGWHNNHYLVSFLFFFEKSKDIQVPKLFLSLLLYRLSADSILKDPKFSLIYIPWVSPSWGFWEKKKAFTVWKDQPFICCLWRQFSWMIVLIVLCLFLLLIFWNDSHPATYRLPRCICPFSKLLSTVFYILCLLV